MFGRGKKVVEVLKGEIVRLQKHNDVLLDRLMARSLPELKTFSSPEAWTRDGEAVKWDEDDTLAGLEVDEEEEKIGYENR